MYYTRLQVVCDVDFSEILMAEIAEVGFDSFLETENGFEAYIEGERYNKESLAAVKAKYAHVNPLLFYQDKIRKQNWNEEWEKNVEPIIVDDNVLVRADFHKIKKKYPYEIIITPKMSFGTGHHQTTYLMLRNQVQLDHRSKRVMDAGCGTAILSIMASKLGANEVQAFDIDEWSVLNGRENIEVNKCQNVHVQQGKIRELDFRGTFDIILANINKNVLLDEIKVYSMYLMTGGLLVLSGFYTTDVEDLIKTGTAVGLNEKSRDERESWASLVLLKG